MNDKRLINTRTGKLIDRKSTYRSHGGTKESHAILFFFRLESETQKRKKYQA
jgi:hypothetical protein